MIVLLTLPAVATIRAYPSAFAVMLPFPSTSATSGSIDSQEMPSVVVDGSRVALGLTDAPMARL